MLLLNNETRKIIFPFPVLWFWLRRPTIQFPGSVTWSFNYCVVVYSISVTNLCDTIISLSQLVTPCYISCTWVSCRTAISWDWAPVIESLTSSCIVLSNLFIWLPYYNQAEAKGTLWLRFQTRETNKKYKWVPRPAPPVRLEQVLVTMTMTTMVRLNPSGRRWTSKPRIRKCSIVMAPTSFRVTLGTRHR